MIHGECSAIELVLDCLGRAFEEFVCKRPPQHFVACLVSCLDADTFTPPHRTHLHKTDSSPLASPLQLGWTQRQLLWTCMLG